MRSYQPASYALTTILEDSDEKKFSLALDSPEHPDAVEEKNIENIIQALVRGGTKTYGEKIKLAFRSSFLTLPFLFVNASFIFLDTQKKLETAMLSNIYYQYYFPNLIKTFSYEGSIVSAEAVSITSVSVLLTTFITLSSLIQQGLHYQNNKLKMKILL